MNPCEGAKYIPGLRRITPDTVASQLTAMTFGGLPFGVTRGGLMRAIEGGGPDCGLTRAQTERLVYLVRHTMDLDWHDDGSTPIVWVSVSRMAWELRVGVRRINEVERELAETGWIAHKDSGNRRRWGERDPETGQVGLAFGIDLSPLGARYGELVAAAERREAEWPMRRAVRDISASLRCEIRQLLASLDRLEEFGALTGDALPVMACLDTLDEDRRRLDAVRVALRRELVAEHGKDDERDRVEAQDRASDDVDAPRLVKAVDGRFQAELLADSADPVGSARPEQNFRHILIQTDSTVTYGGNRPAVDGTEAQAAAVETADAVPATGGAGDEAPKQGKPSRRRRLGDPGDCGVCHLQPDRVAAVGSMRLRALAGTDPGWEAVFDAASLRRCELGISDAAWRAALQALGWIGAAVLVVVIDGRCGERARFVWSPSGFAMACAERGRRGALHLHKSVWGIEHRRRFRKAWSPYGEYGNSRWQTER